MKFWQILPILAGFGLDFHGCWRFLVLDFGGFKCFNSNVAVRSVNFHGIWLWSWALRCGAHSSFSNAYLLITSVVAILDFYHETVAGWLHSMVVLWIFGCCMAEAPVPSTNPLSLEFMRHLICRFSVGLNRTLDKLQATHIWHAFWLAVSSPITFSCFNSHVLDFYVFVVDLESLSSGFVSVGSDMEWYIPIHY